MNKNASIKIENLSKIFKIGLGRKYKVLNNLSLDINENEIFGYLGANGAGKTTTFKLILGLIHADQGEIYFWGKPASDYRNRSILGYLPENPYFYSYLTAAESLDFYASLFDMDGRTKKDRINDLLSLVGLEHARDLQLRKFSRGMLQRVGIAQALINDPKLLILDEPMSGLDPMGRKNMRDIILKCREQGKTIIFSSHIISDVEMVCDRASILEKGELKKIIDVEEMVKGGADFWELVCNAGEKEISQLCDRVPAGGEVNITKSGNRIILTVPGKDTAYALIDDMKKYDINLISFGPRRKNLEDIYITNITDTGKKSAMEQGNKKNNGQEAARP